MDLLVTLYNIIFYNIIYFLISPAPFSRGASSLFIVVAIWGLTKTLGWHIKKMNFQFYYAVVIYRQNYIYLKKKREKEKNCMPS